MELTLRELLEANPSLEKIFKSSVDQKLIYRSSKMVKKVSKEIEDIEESRMDLIEKYGGKKKEEIIPGLRPRIYYTFENDAKEKAFEKEWKDFLKEKITLDIQPIPFVYIKKLLEAGILCGYDLAYLEGFIVAPSEAEAAELEAIEKEKPKEPAAGPGGAK